MKKHIGDFNTILYLEEKEPEEICKLGQGGECCPFLVCGGKGFERYKMNYPSNTTIHSRIDKGTMNAKGKGCDWESVVEKADLVAER